MTTRRWKRSPELGRRALLGGVVGTAVTTGILPGFALTSCSPSSSEAEAARVVPLVARRTKTLHVAFPLELLVLLRRPEHASRLSLFVGGASHPLSAHTPATLAAASNHALYGKPTETPTHYVEGAAFSVEGVQSYKVLYTTADGRYFPLLAGIHIPTARDVAASDSNDDAPDPFHLSVDDAALWCIYHDPGILSLEPTTATMVAKAARACAEFDALRLEIRRRLVTTTSAMLERGEAWISSVFDLDEAGQKIPALALDGSPRVDGSGATVWQTSYVGAPAVVTATRALLAAATTRMNGDPAFEGVRYLPTQGVDVVPSGLTSSGTSTPFICLDSGTTVSRRTVDFHAHGHEFTVEMKNRSAVGSLLLVQSVSATGTKIVGWAGAPGVFFPSIPFPPGSEYTTEAKVEVDVPEDANEVHVWTAAAAFSRGVRGELVPDDIAAYRDVMWALDALVDFVLPVMLLGMGIGGARANKSLRDVVKHSLVHVVEEGGLELIVELLASFTGKGKSLGDRFEEAGAAVGAGVVKFMARLGPQIFGGIAATIVAELVVEATAEKCVPIVGWTTALLGVAQSLVQLGFVEEHVRTGKMLTRHRAVATSAVKVAVAPSKEDAQFPDRAAKYAVTLTPTTEDEAFRPMEARGVFASSENSFDVAFDRVPRMALVATVTLFDRFGTAVAEGKHVVPAPSGEDEEREIELETVGIPFVVTPKSRLVHTRKLAATATGHTWAGTAAVPVAMPGDDDRSISTDPRGLRVGGFGALTYSQQRQKIGYAFKSPCSPDAFSFHTQDAERGSTNVKRTACGASHAMMVVHSLADHHCIVARTGEDLLVFPYDPTSTDLASFVGTTTAASGRLHGTEVLHARMHRETGALTAITDFGLEIVCLGVPSGAPPSAAAQTRRGTRAGQLLSPVSVAPFRTKHRVAVLESGLNRRIQVFDLDANPMDLPVVSLEPVASDPFTRLVHLDLDVDADDNYWVVGLDPEAHSFSLRVYAPTGAPIVTFKDVNAYRLALNSFNELWALSPENFPGPGGYSEPSVSLWLPYA
ncbi:MAG: hypothetical protein U0169_19860 [Polyangiaceae bacterium]